MLCKSIFYPSPTDGYYEKITNALRIKEVVWFANEPRLVSLSLVRDIGDEVGKVGWQINAGVSELSIYGKDSHPRGTIRIPKYLEVYVDEVYPPDYNAQPRWIYIPIVLTLEEPYMGLSALSNKKVRGGVSAMNFKYKGPGTLGCLVQLKTDNTIYALSNWHVFVNSNGILGDKIMHPSRYHGGHSHKDTIGHLVWYRLDYYMDAALAQMDTNIDALGGNLNFDSLKNPITPKIGMEVTKTGASTQTTVGTVVAFLSSVAVNHPEYPSGRRVFRDQIKCKLEADSGDSGAVITTPEGHVLGLLFAGNPISNTYCLANRLAFDKEIEGGIAQGIQNIGIQPIVNLYH